jgi:nicotinamidase-related amidase
MPTIRPGNTPALLIVDVQRDVVATAHDRDRIVGNVALTVLRAREAGVPVIWIQHNDEEYVRGSEGWAWVKELGPHEDEPLIHKTFNSAFEDTTLDALLARLGVTHIILAGAATNWCIRATAYGALDRGYDLTLVSDAHTTKTMEMPDGRRMEAAMLIDDLNMVMRWLAYPGRVNGTAKATEVDFAKPGGTK